MTAVARAPATETVQSVRPPTPSAAPARHAQSSIALHSFAPPSLRLGAGTPLATPMRTRLESSFGASLGAVRVHAGGSAAATADRIGAKAFAFGPDIVLGSGARA